MDGLRTPISDAGGVREIIDCPVKRTASMTLLSLKPVSVLASHSLRQVRRPSASCCGLRRSSCMQVCPSWKAPKSQQLQETIEATQYTYNRYLPITAVPR